VFEDKLLWRIFGSWRRQQEATKNKKMRRYIIFIPFQTFITMRKSLKMR
jgi:hypothetical protein